MSANKQLMSLANIVFIITGLYFAIVAAAGEGSAYTGIGALLCFVSAGLALKEDWLISAPWRLATSAFSIVLLIAQLAADFTVNNVSAIVAVSVLINGVLFVLMVGIFLRVGRDLTVREGEEEEEEEEEPESKKKKLTYEI
jgi:hypothetical protein